MTYNQELLNEAQEALRRADGRIWLLEQQVRERDALIGDYERLMRNICAVGVVMLGVMGFLIWKLLTS